jgi:hypothetical protein
LSVPDQIAVYEPESAGLITTLGRLRFSLRVALTGDDLLVVAREANVGLVIIGATADPTAADALHDRLLTAAPGLTIVRARVGERSGTRRDGEVFLRWPLDHDDVVTDVLAALGISPLEAKDTPRVQRLPTGKVAARAFPAVDWDSLDDITLSMPARSVASTEVVASGSDEAGGAAKGEDPWEVISTVVEHPEGSTPSTVRESRARAPESWAETFADVTRAVWTMRALSETTSLHEMSADERASLARHARTLGKVLDQVSALIKDPPPLEEP